MQKPKIILGVESSCDETAASVGKITESRVQILSNIVASSLEIQSKYGGVVPEQAAREQLKSIIPVIESALTKAFSQLPATSYQLHTQIDAVAVTQGPGLIGSLLVGVETAKTLALVWGKPLVPVNHLIGHFYANWISSPVIARSEATKQSQAEIAALLSVARNDKNEIPKFPVLGLLVSGGHTDLILMKGHGKYEYIGGTRDDAAGECFDKCARLLGLPYPGGPAISKLAKDGNPKAFNLPRPMMDSKDFDFSFSGLKTAVANLVKTTAGGAEREISGVDRTLSEAEGEDAPEKPKRQDPRLPDLCASIEAAIVDVLVKKTIAAAQRYKVGQVIVAGGVAANRKLTESLTRAVENADQPIKLFVPPPKLCTDNAAMITAAAFYNYQPIDPLKLQANPNLSLSHK